MLIVILYFTLEGEKHLQISALRGEQKKVSKPIENTLNINYDFIKLL